MYTLEKNVPMPDQEGNESTTKLIRLMEVGDSFTFHLPKRNSIAFIAWKEKPKKFTTKKISDTECRIWRIE